MDPQPQVIATGQRSPRWCVWKWLSLKTRDGQVYLDRLRLIQTPYFGIYLHWIVGPDPDHDPHDHPWSFWSLVLRGGYKEVYYRSERNLEYHNFNFWGRWSLHRMQSEGIAHRIVQVIPNTTTLVLVGRRHREWGFWTDGGAMRRGGPRIVEWVPWQEYEKRPGSKQVNY